MIRAPYAQHAQFVVDYYAQPFRVSSYSHRLWNSKFLRFRIVFRATTGYYTYVFRRGAPKFVINSIDPQSMISQLASYVFRYVGNGIGYDKK